MYMAPFEWVYVHKYTGASFDWHMSTDGVQCQQHCQLPLGGPLMLKCSNMTV
jgi:hypothetical protein